MKILAALALVLICSGCRPRTPAGSVGAGAGATRGAEAGKAEGK